MRRGLFGELLYRFSLFTHLSYLWIIIPVCIGSFIFVLFFFLRKLHQQNEKWWIALSPFLCGLSGFVIRKDFLQMALLIGILYAVKHIIENGRHKELFRGLVLVLCFLELFMHEAFFFWGIPIVAVLMMRGHKLNWANVVIFLSIIVLFAILCVFKGDAHVAFSIAQSWNKLVGSDIIHGGVNTIGSLGWETGNTFAKHLWINFYNENLEGWSGIFFRPLMLVVSYYFITNFFGVFSLAKRGELGEWSGTDSEKRNNIGAIYLFLIVCMLPMFTVLSCDYGRLYQYGCMVAVAVYLIFPQNLLHTLFPRWYMNIISGINRRMSNFLQPSVGLMIIILLFVAPAPAGFYIFYAINQTTYGAIVQMIMMSVNRFTVLI